MTHLTFIKTQHPDGSFGVTVQDPLSEEEAERLRYKLNLISSLVYDNF